VSKLSLTNKSGVEHKREMNASDFDSQCIKTCDKNFEGEKALECKLDCSGHWYYLSGRVLNDSTMICTSSKWLHQQALLHVTIWRILHDDGLLEVLASTYKGMGLRLRKTPLA
jgi:hypothetical protein